MLWEALSAWLNSLNSYNGEGGVTLSMCSTKTAHGRAKIQTGGPLTTGLRGLPPKMPEVLTTHQLLFREQRTSWLGPSWKGATKYLQNKLLELAHWDKYLILEPVKMLPDFQGNLLCLKSCCVFMWGACNPPGMESLVLLWLVWQVALPMWLKQHETTLMCKNK